jgi:hypothetical protein
MPPIVLASTTNHDTLVDAIQRASALNVPLLLEPGTHLTKPGRGRPQQIAIGSNGLQLAPASPPVTPPQNPVPAVINGPTSPSTRKPPTTATVCSSSLPPDRCRAPRHHLLEAVRRRRGTSL